MYGFRIRVHFGESFHRKSCSLRTLLPHLQADLHRDVQNDKESKQSEPNRPRCNGGHGKEEPEGDVDESQNQTQTAHIFVEQLPDKSACCPGTISVFMRTAKTNIHK